MSSKPKEFRAYDAFTIVVWRYVWRVIQGKLRHVGIATAGGAYGDYAACEVEFKRHYATGLSVLVYGRRRGQYHDITSEVQTVTGVKVA